MKLEKLKNIILNEVKKLHNEQRVGVAPTTQAGTTSMGAGNNVTQMQQQLFQDLGNPQTWDAVVTGYNAIYNKNRQRLRGQLMDPRQFSKKVRARYGTGNPTPPTPQGIWPLVGAILLRAGYFAAGAAVGYAIAGGGA